MGLTVSRTVSPQYRVVNGTQRRTFLFNKLPSPHSSPAIKLYDVKGIEIPSGIGYSRLANVRLQVSLLRVDRFDIDPQKVLDKVFDACGVTGGASPLWRFVSSNDKKNVEFDVDTLTILVAIGRYGGEGIDIFASRSLHARGRRIAGPEFASSPNRSAGPYDPISLPSYERDMFVDEWGRPKKGLSKTQLESLDKRAISWFSSFMVAGNIGEKGLSLLMYMSA